MRIMLNKILPSMEELSLLDKMGFEVSNIKDQHRNRHYYVELRSDLDSSLKQALTQRLEKQGRNRSVTTISFYGIDVIYINKNIFIDEISIKVKMDIESAKRALAKREASILMTETGSQIEPEDTAPKAPSPQAFTSR